MKKLFLVIFGAVFGFVLVAGDTSSPYAQENAIDEFTLEEITVTAQKREENQQDVPIAMEVISGDDIKERGYNNLDEILSNIAGVIINRAGDGMRVSIRGMSDDVTPTGSLSTFSTSTPSVAVNMDGVFTSRRNSGQGLYDLERVEVLYGPQSTLYASNSPGGIVNIETADPKTDIYEISGTLEYGSYNTLHTEGVMNAPLNETWALRTAFTTSAHDGYMANGSDDEDTKSARVKALCEPNDKISFVVTGEYTRRGGSGYSGIDNFISQDDLDDPWNNLDDDSSEGMGSGTPRYEESKKTYAHLDWDLGIGTLSVVPAYSTNSMSATTAITEQTGETTTTLMEQDGTERGGEIRIASSPDSFSEWILGANYYRSNQSDHQMPETGLYQNRENNQKTYAFYGNITYPVSGQLRATGGLRYSGDKNYTLFESLMRNPVTGAIDVVYDETQPEYSGPDYKIGLEYDLDDGSMFYTDYSTSYRLMGMTLNMADPEKLKSYTIGGKHRFYGNKLQLNWAAFYYDYKNYRADVPMTNPETGRRDEGSETNGDLRKFGVDVQTSTIITSNDKLDLSLSYINTEFTRLFFDYESEYLNDKDYTGKPETFTPEWTINAKYRHNFNLANGGVLTAQIDSRYQSSYLVTFMEEYGADMENPGVVIDMRGYNEQEAHHISNISLNYVHPDGKWSLTGYVNNLENYAVKRNLMMGTTMIGPPRTYGAVLMVKY